MQSKNKKPPSAIEKRHIEQIKQMSCVVCDAHGPSECHEIKQGQWFTSMPLCSDCHRGGLNGWHGQKRMWTLKKMDMVDALNVTIERLMRDIHGS
jgi:hypothetical protein